MITNSFGLKVLSEICKEDVEVKGNQPKNSKEDEGNEILDNQDCSVSDDSMVTWFYKRKQNEDISKNIEEDEVIEANDNNLVVIIDEPKFSEVFDSSDDRWDEVIVGGYDTQLRAIGGMENFVKKSVQRNGNKGVSMEFIVGDMIKEEGFEDGGKSNWVRMHVCMHVYTN